MRKRPTMKPLLCVIGGCNGAGKTTLAMELLPLMGIERFLNADEIARGLSPLAPSLSAFRAGRLLIEEARALINAGKNFAIESTLSGKTYVTLIEWAKEQGYRVVVHFVVLDSPAQAVQRVAARVLDGGHDVPEDDVRRRFARGRRNFVSVYLPLADAWTVWDNASPPAKRVAGNFTHHPEEIIAMLESSKVEETTVETMSESDRMVVEASRRATAKKLNHYQRMGIKVTPQMTLAEDDNGSEPSPQARRPEITSP